MTYLCCIKYENITIRNDNVRKKTLDFLEVVYTLEEKVKI